MVDLEDPESRNKVVYELRQPGAERIWYIGDAFRMGMTVEEVFNLPPSTAGTLYSLKILFFLKLK